MKISNSSFASKITFITFFPRQSIRKRFVRHKQSPGNCCGAAVNNRSKTPDTKGPRPRMNESQFVLLLVTPITPSTVSNVTVLYKSFDVPLGTEI